MPAPRILRHQLWQEDLFRFEVRDHRRHGGGPVDIHLAFWNLRLWICPVIDEWAFRDLTLEMAGYRPDRSEADLRRILMDVLSSGFEPMAETEQDILHSYLRGLDRRDQMYDA